MESFILEACLQWLRWIGINGTVRYPRNTLYLMTCDDVNIDEVIGWVNSEHNPSTKCQSIIRCGELEIMYYESSPPL